MVDARPNRRIPFYAFRIVPFKHLISPLLLVNLESRTCAKAFYNVKLDIYAVPPVDEDKVKLLDKKSHWDDIRDIEKAVNGKIRGYRDMWTIAEFHRRRVEHFQHGDDDYDGDAFDEYEWADYQKSRREEDRYTVDLEEHWSLFVSSQLRKLGLESLARIDRSGPTTGAFYISPEHDVFVVDYSFGKHFCVEQAFKILGADFCNLKTTAYHHASEKMSRSTRNRVSTIVLVRVAPSSGNEMHCVFASDSIFRPDRNLDPLDTDDWHPETSWKVKGLFPCVRAYFVLRRNDRKPWHHFLEDLNDPDSAKLSKYLEQWGRESSFTDEEGRVAWKLEMKKGTGYGLKKADWVRDLMAHWDTEK